MRVNATILVFLAIMLSAGATCWADQVSTQRINPPRTPATIERCQIDATDFPSAWVNVENRTKHQMLTFDVQYSFYDADRAMFGQTTIQYTPATPLASGDVQQFSGTLYSSAHSEPYNATSYVKCRVMAATFTGQRSWRYGQQWREPLISAYEPTPADAAHSTVTAATSEARIQVLSAWADSAKPYQTGYYVHDRLTVTAGRSETIVYPHDFTLRTYGPAGTSRVRGFDRPAPTYTKVNYALNQSSVVPEVDPMEDLGAHIPLQLHPGASATTVVTFYVADSSLDTSRLSEVSYT
jgi:hypothetical protein